MSKHLSIVITGRNDNYGGDFNRRLQNTIHWLFYWLNQHKISSEIVFVNYNPLSHQPSIATMIDFPTATDWASVREIIVPTEIHEKIIAKYARVCKPVPVMEFIAKNIGIRRAQGEFVLATNADVIFDPELFRHLAENTWQKGVFYRATRVDFELAKPLSFTNNPAEFLAEIKTNVFKFFLKGGTFVDRSHFSIEKKLRYLSLFNGFRKIIYTAIFPFRNIFKHLSIPYTEELFTFQHFCNASGDFMLMSKEDWGKMNGYPENTWISTHTDSLHLIMSSVTGLKEKILPYLVYHQEHERRFDFNTNNPDMDKMYERLLKDSEAMLSTKKVVGGNDTSWGMDEFIFEEKTY
jgi:hypothetical protein